MKPLASLLASLSLALAVSPVQAGQIVREGAAGASGVSGSPPATGPGGDGAAGQGIQHIVLTSDAYNTLTLTGGRGGDGGAGYTQMPWPGEDWPPPQGPGGTGADGGAADGSLTAQRVRGSVSANTVTRGGNGGQGGVDGCCASGSGQGGAGGAASSVAHAATGAGAGTATVRARATGGNAGVTRDGGAASANARGVSVGGAVSGQATAQGGSGGDGRIMSFGLTYYAGNGGNASATLALQSAGLATGLAQATGGNAGGAYTGSGQGGTADVTLELRGAGATGSATAANGDGYGNAAATSVARAFTTGALAVDLTSTARGSSYSAGTAATYVDAGYTSAAAGTATVTGRAVASGGGYAGPNRATLTLLGNGAIVGASEARGADGWEQGGCYGGCGPAGSAASVASGNTRGSGQVDITALAVGGKPGISLPYGGSATAVASGQSASGKVTAKATAVSEQAADVGGSSARATATTLVAGGATYAEARHSAGQGVYDARADASSAGSGGARAVAIGEGVRGNLVTRAESSGGGLAVVTGSTIGIGMVGDGGAANTANTLGASSAANVGGERYPLPAGGNAVGSAAYAYSNANANANAGAIDAVPANGHAAVHWLGTGVMGVMTATGIDDGSALSATTTASFSFNAQAGQQLVLGLFGLQPQGDVTATSLDFAVTSNGVVILTRTLAGEQLSQWFDDQFLTLALYGGSLQNLGVSAVWSAGGAGFHYAVGVTPVPEPGAWLMLVLGLALLFLTSTTKPKTFNS